MRYMEFVESFDEVDEGLGCVQLMLSRNDEKINQARL